MSAPRPLWVQPLASFASPPATTADWPKRFSAGSLRIVRRSRARPGRARVCWSSTILEAAGFDAMTANNGLEAVIVAYYARPPVVLMDVTMPVLDGLEAARLMQASPVTRDMKVIAYIAKPDAFDAPWTRWFVDVIPKPASADAIVSSIQRYAAIRA
jgi:CheY-like chemotaxis protein